MGRPRGRHYTIYCTNLTILFAEAIDSNGLFTNFFNIKQPLICGNLYISEHMHCSYARYVLYMEKFYCMYST